MTRSVRVMVFYDGAFFRAGQLFFRYKEKRGWFSLPALHETLERYVSEKIKAADAITKIVAAHYYDGRMTTNVAAADQLEKERDFEMALMAAGIVTHFLPAKETAKGSGQDLTYSIAQKGVDVQFAVDVLDHAHQDRYDVAVLITGDEDFLPLVRRVISLGKHVLVAYFDIDPWQDDRSVRHKPTKASRALVDASSWSLNFNSFAQDPEQEGELRHLFFMPKQG